MLRLGDSAQPEIRGQPVGEMLTWHKGSLLSLPRMMGI